MIVDYKKVFSAVVLVAGVFVAIPVSAANYILQGITCIDTGLCTPCDLIDVGVNGAEMILGLSGVVILLIFIYGGLMWMISYGDSKKIEKGSSAIRAAVIGMVIVFISYSAVELLWQALRSDEAFRNSVQCTPLNIPSGGYLGNSQTGGGQAPKSEYILATVPDLTSPDEGMSPDNQFANPEDWDVVENYFSGERSNERVIIDRRVNPPEVIRQSATEIIAQGANAVPSEVLNVMARNCPAGYRCDFSAQGAHTPIGSIDDNL